MDTPIVLGTGAAGENPSTLQGITDAADSQTTQGAGKLAGVVARMQLWNGTFWGRLFAAGAAGDATSSELAVAIYNYNGASWDRQRTPVVFKILNAVVITSETTIWTPTAGKKFRLMGYVLTQGVATGAVILKDNTAGATIYIIPPNTIGVVIPQANLGNGILSAAANNVLTATGASTETLTGVVFGTEE